MRLSQHFCLPFLVFTQAAIAADAHVHGVATLDVTIEARTLTLRFATPLDNLLGFEREPRNESERGAVRRMADTLYRAKRLFVPSPAARCRVTDLKLASPVLGPGLLEAWKHGISVGFGSGHQHKHGNDHQEGHAELTDDVMFRCVNAVALDGLEVRLFDRFARLRRIDVQIIGPRGQSAATLTPEATRLNW